MLLYVYIYGSCTTVVLESPKSRSPCRVVSTALLLPLLRLLAVITWLPALSWRHADINFQPCTRYIDFRHVARNVAIGRSPDSQSSSEPRLCRSVCGFLFEERNQYAFYLKKKKLDIFTDVLCELLHYKPGAEEQTKIINKWCTDISVNTSGVNFVF